MTQTNYTSNAFGSILSEGVWSRSSKNYRCLSNEYCKLTNDLREYRPDYYPFGSTLPTRSWNDASRAYRYGFNGVESDEDLDCYLTNYRLFSDKICRWFSTDKLSKADLSSYNSFSNSPITRVDPLGLSDYYTISGEYLASDGSDGTDVHIVTDADVIALIRKNRIEIGTDKTYFKYEASLNEGTYFTLPPYSERQDIQKAMETQAIDQRNEIGGMGYKSSENNTTYHARAVDGKTVTLEQLKKLFLTYINEDELFAEDIPMPFNVKTGVASDEESLTQWKLKNLPYSISYTWHSHPYEVVYGQKILGANIYDIVTGSSISLNGSNYNYITINGTKAKASSQPSERDISESNRESKVDNYTISKGAGTVTHYKGGTVDGEMSSSFFYNVQAKPKR